MAFLTPDAERTEYGVTIKEKIIPWGAKWQRDSGKYKKGQKYKADKKLSNGTGKVQWITVHNTGRIKHNANTTDAEQYTRATYPNCNMGDVRVHYFVDDTEAWQNLREDEIGWHSADGNTGGGNGTSVAIECIMKGSGDDIDKKSYDNCARLTAALLVRHGLTTYNIMSHYAWMRKAGKKSPRYCPQYILPVWEEFKQLVQMYIDAYKAAAPTFTAKDSTRAFGIVSGIIKPTQDDITKYDLDYNGKITIADALKVLKKVSSKSK